MAALQRGVVVKSLIRLKIVPTLWYSSYRHMVIGVGSRTFICMGLHRPLGLFQ
jgi:hypothetical protein